MEKMILLFDTNYFERMEVENIENKTYNSEQFIEIIDMAKEKETTIGVYSLTDFMDLCNNQEVYLDGYWISYVNYIKTN
tara:strand:- start:599 stop:835 length:237 start_codon:yes stop_codon:yes gene_type:complete